MGMYFNKSRKPLHLNMRDGSRLTLIPKSRTEIPKDLEGSPELVRLVAKQMVARLPDPPPKSESMVEVSEKSAAKESSSSELSAPKVGVTVSVEETPEKPAKKAVKKTLSKKSSKNTSTTSSKSASKKASSKKASSKKASS